MHAVPPPVSPARDPLPGRRPSRARRRTLASATALALALGTAAGSVALTAPAAADATNAKPAVVPTLKEWTGGSGSFDLDASTRIVVPAALEEMGRQVATDIAELTARTVPVALDVAPDDGDIVLVVDPALVHAAGGERFDEEGYVLDVDPGRVTVTAPTEQGVFYGTRSFLQVLVQSPGRGAVPVGESVDWPDYASRGFMLDVGRRFFTPEFVRDYISMMSWFKLNEFQIHLMDNEISPAGGNWANAQAGFRLASDNPAFAGLASTDGAYDRADWQSFEDTAAAHAVTIIPEIEGPAHARSVVRWKPELGTNGGNSDHLDLSKPEATAVMKSIFTEFAPWFEGPDVHMGVDEYYASPALFRDYFNTMAAHVRSLGKHPRAWGSFTQMHGNANGYDRDVTINSWNGGWYSIESAFADGYRFLNTDDSTLYVVPFASYYHGNGLNNQWLYSSWAPNRTGNKTVPEGAAEGAMFAVWNDLVHADYTQQDVHGLVELSFPTIAQKTWDGATPELTFAQFSALTRTLGLGPGIEVVDFTRGGRLAGELSHGATVTASSSDQGNAPEHLTDGQTTTRWSTRSTAPATLTVDLGSVQTVGAVEVDWTAAAATSYTVEVSADGSAWTRAARHRNVTGAGVDRATFDAHEARYVRLSSVVGGPDGVGAWRLSVLGRPDLALGGVATASGVEGGTAMTAANVVDGDPSTRWSADYSAQPWVQVDLGVARTVDEITLRWEAASATAYRVEVSQDGSSWSALATRTGLAGGARTDVLTVPATAARYVRVTTTAKSLSPYLSLYDLEVRGAAPSEPAQVTATATVRCVAGRAQVSVDVVNDDAAPVDLVVTTPYGSRSFAGLSPDKRAHAAFSTRTASVADGTAVVDVAPAGAPERAVPVEVPFTGADCG